MNTKIALNKNKASAVYLGIAEMYKSCNEAD